MMDFSTQIDNQSPSQLHSKHFLQASLIFVLILEFICLVTSIEPFDSLSSDWLEVLSSLHNSSHPYLCLQFPFLTCRNKFCILKGHMYPHGYLHTTYYQVLWGHWKWVKQHHRWSQRERDTTAPMVPTEVHTPRETNSTIISNELKLAVTFTC